MIQEEKIEKRRIRGSHITTVLSIALVLFILGIQGLMMGYTHKIADYVRENIGFTVIMKEYTREQDIFELQELIEKSPYVKSTRYITKQEAAKELQESLGQDFIEFLGYNPLLSSIEVHLKAEYTHADSIAVFENEITRYHNVKEMYYQKDLVTLVNDNVKKISLWLFILSAIVLVVAVSLINNTMRLLIYSKRFIINSMQLVGAKSGFIRRPFLKTGFVQGLIGGIIACLFLTIGLLYLNSKIPAIISKNDAGMIFMIYLVVIGIGILFTVISAWFSVNKYLRMRNTDTIYH